MSPARPTKGRPWRSSFSPGPSPMNISLVFASPSPKTVCVLCSQSRHLRQILTSFLFSRLSCASFCSAERIGLVNGASAGADEISDRWPNRSIPEVVGFTAGFVTTGGWGLAGALAIGAGGGVCGRAGSGLGEGTATGGEVTSASSGGCSSLTGSMLRPNARSARRARLARACNFRRSIR